MRHAIATAAAEAARQLVALAVNKRLDLGSHRWLFVEECQELLELVLALDAPNGQHRGMGGHERHRRLGVRDEPARHRLHADEAYVALGAQLHELLFTLAGKVAERELQCFVQAAFHQVEGNLYLVRGHADMTDLALGLRFQHALIHAAAVSRRPYLVHHVELVHVDVVGLQVRKRGLEVLPELLGRLGLRFRGYIHLVTHTLECNAELFLGIGVGARRIEVAHAAFVCPADNRHRIVKRAPLHRQRSKRVLIDGDSRASQRYLVHSSLL